MREIVLRTTVGAFVAIVDIAYFPDTGMPNVVTWGSRTFLLHEKRASKPWVYRETFAYYSFTPSPGRSEPEELPPPPVDRSAREVLGEAVGPGLANTELRPDGQQKGYVVLSEAERAKGFVRPVRRTYVHIGKRPKHPTRPLTEEESQLYKDEFSAYEPYPEEMAPRKGRFWTSKELTSGCNETTTMSPKLAETYARDPKFYSGTFCSTCGEHFDVGEDGEFAWAGTTEKVGT